MCGRRLLEPRRADGSSHFVATEVDNLKNRFLNTFDWAHVKNYNVDILVEKWEDSQAVSRAPGFWDEEVEIYDIRDYVGVVVSGILGKSRNLCKLNVRIGLSKFSWSEKELLDNVKTIVGPFERLRNVRQPRLRGIYDSTPHTNFMISLPLPVQARAARAGPEVYAKLPTPLCSVPQLPAQAPLKVATDPCFADFRSEWERWLSSTASSSVIHKPPIRAMFTQFKEFYSKLSCINPTVMQKTGRKAFLHRARVAREKEDVVAFRELRNELIEYWYSYWELEEQKKADIERKLSKMLDVDVYPSTMSNSFTQMSLQPPLPTNVPAMMPQAGSIFNPDTKHDVQLPPPQHQHPQTLDSSPSPPALHQHQIQQTMALNPRPPLPNGPLSLHYAQLKFFEEQSRRTLLRLLHQHETLSQPPPPQSASALPFPPHSSSNNNGMPTMPDQSSFGFHASSGSDATSAWGDLVSPRSWEQQRDVLQRQMQMSQSHIQQQGLQQQQCRQWPQQQQQPQQQNPSSPPPPPPFPRPDSRKRPSPSLEEPSPVVARVASHSHDDANKRPRRQERTDSGLGLDLSVSVSVAESCYSDSHPTTSASTSTAKSPGPQGSSKMVEVKEEKLDDNDDDDGVRFGAARQKMRWVDDGRREVNENGDEVMVVEAGDDVFEAWGSGGGVVGKGKGKMDVEVGGWGY